jgi:hypothetical protein
MERRSNLKFLVFSIEFGMIRCMNKRFFALFLILGMCVGTRVEAARAPELFVNVTTGTAAAQISVLDGDANTPVLFYYQTNGTTHSAPIGTTNASGNLNAIISASAYGIAVGSRAYVIVNGASSPFVTWPDYTSGGSLPLSPTSLTLAPDKTGTVTASVSADLSLGSNSAPSVATATVSGQQIVVRALTSGADSISICASGLGCSTITVNVISSSGSNVTPATFSISTTMGNGSQVTLDLGQKLSVPLLGDAAHIFLVSSNSNPTAVDASPNGTSLYLTGLAYGGSNIQVCEFEGQCAMIYAYVATPKVSSSTPTPVPSPVTPVPTPVTASHATFTSYLKPGSTGPEVRALQNILIKLGYLKHVATGNYARLTVDAVAALQHKHNLAALGVVGPATRALLNAMAY